ncbi:MAG TPA: hypothetical protein VNS58_16260 [Puia sp.]|nr:hypothetical protein [Puia sp.]
MVVSFDWYKYSVVFGFMKREIKTAVMPDMHWPGLSGPVKSESRDCEGPKAGASEDFFHLANAIKSELSVHIRMSAIRRLGKQELLLSLRNLLKPYTALAVQQAYAFRVAISNAIEEEVKKYCSIHLNRQELLKLWQSGGEWDLC